MIQRKCRESFSQTDEERLLAFMHGLRHLAIRYGSAYLRDSNRHGLSRQMTAVIDKMAEQLTGDPKFFWLGNSSAGGPHPRESEIKARQQRELRWVELRRTF